jgi:ABC-2 type transport system permease protein
MFLVIGNIEDPIIPKVLSGLLNTLLYFPSGAIYPVESFPRWLRMLSWINPMTYMVHGFRSLMLKDVPAVSILPDVLVLSLIGTLSLVLASRTFKRTL